LLYDNVIFVVTWRWLYLLRVRFIATTIGEYLLYAIHV